MKKFYYDYKQFSRDDQDGPTAFFMMEAEALPAGTEVYAMSVKDKCEEYDRIAKKRGIHFIFEDSAPEAPFYAVPYLCVFATDGGAGFFAARRIPDLAEDEPVYYIPGRKKVYQVADSLQELIYEDDRWQEHLRQARKIRLYASREAAERNQPFVDREAFTCKCYDHWEIHDER